MPVEVGDLVGFYRRKTPGMGIVMQKMDDVLEASGRQMINHRGPEFKEILFRITERLKAVYPTDGDMYVITGSGSGAMEAAIVNTLSPGDRVLAVTVGAFGDRFAHIAEVFGLAKVGTQVLVMT